jgi:hypothetical protein
MLWYWTELMNAGMPMPVASASMPMPSYVENAYRKPHVIL